MKPATRIAQAFQRVPTDLWVALFALAVYLVTMSRTVTAEDCGEIAAALHGLAIVHPTGYSLFTMLGWIFAHLPTGARGRRG